MQGEASTRLGFTDYFRVELAWAKLLGAVLLLAPVPARLKEWAYAAFAITLGSALIAHLSIGEGPRRRGAGQRAPGVLWGLSGLLWRRLEGAGERRTARNNEQRVGDLRIPAHEPGACGNIINMVIVSMYINGHDTTARPDRRISLGTSRLNGGSPLTGR